MSGKKLVAAIVGVGPGIGRSVAVKFAKEGYSVALIARSKDKLVTVQEEIEKFNGKAISVTADATDQKQIEAAFAQIRAELGDPSVLVYNASGFGMSSIQDIKVVDVQNAFNLTAVGALIATQQVLPHMKSQKSGSIIFTGATASLRGASQFAPFAMSKFALRALAQSMARELGPEGIHIAHVITDGRVIDGVSKDNKQLSADYIADTYFIIHSQHPSVWTHEMDIRPFCEKF